MLDGGELKCFGANTAGQIGSGGTVALGDATSEMGDALAAVSLGAGRSVRAVSAGNLHTCAVLDNASVKCFGEGDNGRLGYGATTDIGRTTASMGDGLPAVDLGTGRTAKLLATGAAHTCVVLDNDAVKCWGLNDDGQLGLGDTDARGDGAGEMGDALPAVSLGLGAGVRVVAIAAGDAHSCVLLSSGAVQCWGAGGNGRLGSGNENSRGDEAGEMGASLPNVDLGAGRTAKAISVGAAHTCVIRDLNDVVCWGVGGEGQLGIGSRIDIGDGAGEMGAALTAVPLGSGRTAVAVSAGATHTCVVLDNNTVKCWGSGASGRLGTSDTMSRGDQPDELGDNFAAIALGTSRTARTVVAGVAHTCVVLDTWALKCFGLGSSGRLGSGSTSTLGDGANEMGDNLTSVHLGTDRRVMSLTEPGRAGAPTGTAGDGSVALTWAAPASDGGSAITDYVVEYSANDTTWSTFVDGTSALSSATVTGLANATTYRFRVTARNDVADGVVSTASATVTPAAPTTTTLAPTTTATTFVTTTTLAPTTTTTTLAPPPDARSLVLRPFAPLATTLSSTQRRQVAAFAATLTANDNITCVGGAGSGPVRLLRDLARSRANAVCALLARRVPGVRTVVGVAVSGKVQVAERVSTPAEAVSQQVLPALVVNRDLSRRVLVVAQPG